MNYTRFVQILYSLEFERRYKRLPVEIQQKAEEKEKVFREDPFDPRLKTHKLHGHLSDFWAFSIDQRYRIVFMFLEKNTVRFYAVGGHSVYKKF